MRTCTEESFLKNVQNHKIEILHEEGIYRHIRFSKPDSSDQHFDLITTPGLLMYRGDMGCYEFELTRDMFEFFRTDRTHKDKNEQLSINPGDWAEKCRSESRFGGGIKAFSHDSFKETVLNDAKVFAEDNELSGEALEDFNEQIENLVGSVSNDQEAHSVLREWEDFNSIEVSNEGFLDFTANDVFGSDTWEYDFTEHTYRFIWCCYAIAWGIEQYDNEKSAAANELTA